ncbi:MAG: FecR family protein [Patiriisocius sp.]|uniref:FecR family protein n=1 Tax=Patiriisocius sp. TaxID=2822396 RepID=UPI003EF86C00
MKEEEKLKDWLSDSLSEKELKAFEKSSAFGAFYKISEVAKQYKAPEYDVENGLTDILNNRISAKAKFPLYPVLRNIAAILILGVGLFFLFKNNTKDIAVKTENTQKQVTLPDTSSVIINANSTLSYDEASWKKSRNVHLDGEAFFKVAKGKNFHVTTDQGTVTVLGTEFTVQDDKDSFEVMCYEGSVQVSMNDKTYVLLGGNGIKLTNNIIEKTTTLNMAPAWIKTTSVFKSERLATVISQLETTFNITVNTTNVDTSELYTGSFTHQNLAEALKSITIPLGLTYEIDETTVTLKK